MKLVTLHASPKYTNVFKNRPLLLPVRNHMNSVLICPFTLLTISYSIMFFVIIIVFFFRVFHLTSSKQVLSNPSLKHF